MSDLTVTNSEAQSRYEISEDGQVIGFAEYLLSDGLITFTHTEVQPAQEGKGVGSTLIKSALDDVRATGGRSILPLCPFVSAYIRRHPDYRDLLYT